MFFFFKPPFTRESLQTQHDKFMEDNYAKGGNFKFNQMQDEFRIINSILDHCEKYKIKIEPTRKRKKIRMIKKPFATPGKKQEFITAGQFLDLVKEFRKLVK